MKFYSKHKNLVIGIGKKIIKFTALGNAGFYDTEDPKIIESLKAHKDCNAKGIGSFSSHEIIDTKDNVRQGARGTYTPKEESNLKTKFKEYDTLKSEIVKADGTFRADATEELKAKYTELKAEIGL